MNRQEPDLSGRMSAGLIPDVGSYLDLLLRSGWGAAHDGAGEEVQSELGGRVRRVLDLEYDSRKGG